MFKIGIIDKMNNKGIDLLKSNKGFSVDLITDLSRENLLKVLPKYDGVTLRRGVLDSEILTDCKNLKVIARHGVGYDNVDTKYCKENNISIVIDKKNMIGGLNEYDITKIIVEKLNKELPSLNLK